jgi:hypothetical protein
MKRRAAYNAVRGNVGCADMVVNVRTLLSKICFEKID